jgi:hypothetical protein
MPEEKQEAAPPKAIARSATFLSPASSVIPFIE